MTLSKKAILREISFLDLEDKIKYLEKLKDKKEQLSTETNRSVYQLLSKLYFEKIKTLTSYSQYVRWEKEEISRLATLYHKLGARKTKSEQEVLNEEYKKYLGAMKREKKDFPYKETDFYMENYICKEANGNIDEQILKQGLEFLLNQGLYEPYFDFNEKKKIRIDKKVLKNAFNRLFLSSSRANHLTGLIVSSKLDFDFKECEKAIQTFYKKAFFKEELSCDYVDHIKELVKKTKIKPAFTIDQINKIYKRLVRSGELLYHEEVEELFGLPSKFEKKDLSLGYEKFLLDYIGNKYQFNNAEEWLNKKFSKLKINFEDEKIKSITQKIYNKIPEESYDMNYVLQMIYSVTQILPEFNHEKIERVVSILANDKSYGIEDAKTFYNLFSRTLPEKEKKEIENSINNCVINQLDEGIEELEKGYPSKEKFNDFLVRIKECKKEYLGRFPYKKEMNLAEVKLDAFEINSYLKNTFFSEYVKSKKLLSRSVHKS